MLGKVADFQSLAESKLSLHGSQFLTDPFDKGGFARAIDTQYTDSFAGSDRKFHITDDGFVPIAQRDILGFNQMFGQTFGFQKFKTPFAGSAHRLYRF